MVKALALLLCFIKLLLVQSQITDLRCKPVKHSALLRMSWKASPDAKKRTSIDFIKKGQAIRVFKNNAGKTQMIPYVYITTGISIGHFKKGGDSSPLNCGDMVQVINNALEDVSVTKINIGKFKVKVKVKVTEPKSVSIESEPESFTLEDITTDGAVSGVECSFYDPWGFHKKPKFNCVDDTQIMIGSVPSEERWHCQIMKTGASASAGSITNQIIWIDATGHSLISYDTRNLKQRIMDILQPRQIGIKIQIGEFTLQKESPDRIRAKRRVKPGAPAETLSHAAKSMVKSKEKATAPIRYSCEPFDSSNAKQLFNPCKTKGGECATFGRTFSRKEPGYIVCKAATRVQVSTRSKEERPCIPNGGDETIDCWTECIQLSNPDRNECSPYDRLQKGMELHQYRDRECIEFKSINAHDKNVIGGYIWQCPDNAYCRYGQHNVQCDQKKGGLVRTDGEVHRLCRKDLKLSEKDKVKCKDFKYQTKKGLMVDRIPYNTERERVCTQRVWKDGDWAREGLTEDYFIMCVGVDPAKGMLSVPMDYNYVYGAFDRRAMMIIIFVLFIIFGICCFFIGGCTTLIGFVCASKIICKNTNELKCNDWDC